MSMHIGIHDVILTLMSKPCKKEVWKYVLEVLETLDYFSYSNPLEV
jgi:hypothetical protein